MRRYYENHEQNVIKQREYQIKNREKYRASSRKWRETNSDKMAVAKKRWNENNKARNAARAAEYYCRKRRRTPPWLTPDQRAEIRMAYEVAQLFTEELGYKFSVDHIVPLHGKNVCGLHVPWNLQVIPRDANSRKGNRFDAQPIDLRLPAGKG